MGAPTLAPAPATPLPRLLCSPSRRNTAAQALRHAGQGRDPGKHPPTGLCGAPASHGQPSPATLCPLNILTTRFDHSAFWTRPRRHCVCTYPSATALLPTEVTLCLSPKRKQHPRSLPAEPHASLMSVTYMLRLRGYRHQRILRLDRTEMGEEEKKKLMTYCVPVYSYEIWEIHKLYSLRLVTWPRLHL